MWCQFCITSQGQITIPAKIRKAWGITGSQEVIVSFDPKSQRMTIEKPLSTQEFLSIASRLTRHLPAGVRPLKAGEIHELYERERAKEIVARTKESL